MEQITSTGKKWFAQCMTWKDTKQVMFLHTNNIGPSSGHVAARSSRGKKEQSIIPAPQCQVNYAKHFNAVDRNDRDSSDYTTSLRTNRWYLRVVFWLLDRVMHLLFVVTVYCSKMLIGPEWWSLYKKKDGRYDFQIDLGIDLMNYGISKAWPDLNQPRPNWMRQTPFVPCECKKCFFCLKGLTTGIAHRENRSIRTTIVHHDGSRTVTTGCTEVRVDLELGSSYCRQCYRNAPKYNEDGVKMTAVMKRKVCNSSRLGCSSCKEHVCDACWESGYWRHQQKRQRR